MPDGVESWGPRRLGREWDAYFPAAVLLVDRRPILDLFVASSVIPQARLAVVCLDGTPKHVVSWLRRGLRAKRSAPFAYLHDARTVVFPFAFEPLATLVEQHPGPIPFRDLGLPPLGKRATDFGDASLPAKTRVLELEAVPPATLIRYVAREVSRMVAGDPNMLPLTRSPAKTRKDGGR